MVMCVEIIDRGSNNFSTGSSAYRRFTMKNGLLISSILALAGAYVFYFTDLFHPPRIQIVPQIGRILTSRPANGVYPISFTLNKDFRLTSVKVTPVGAVASQGGLIPVWHLTSRSNSAPTHGFLYGSDIQGMKAARPSQAVEPLQPRASYRLSLTAGRAKGEIEFIAPAIP